MQTTKSLHNYLGCNQLRDCTDPIFIFVMYMYLNVLQLFCFVDKA